MSKLQLTALTKKYDSGVLAVDGVNLSVQEGAFCVLLGQEKSGKTSILRMIAGLESITDGDILLDNESIIKKQSKNRNIAMFFQANTLQQNLTIFENIAYGLKLRKENEEKIQKKVEKIATIVGVKHLLSRRPKSLTAIERLKVVLARAIVREPKLFLFDEPFAHLTATQKEEILNILVALQLRFHFTAVYATDCVRDAFLLATHIAVLQDGKLLQQEEAITLFENPASFYIADYLYNFNLDLHACTITKNEENKYIAKYDNMQIVLSEQIFTNKMDTIAKLAATNQQAYIAKSKNGAIFLFDENKIAI